MGRYKVLMIAILAVTAAVLFMGQLRGEGLGKGMKAPDFTLSQLDGTPVGLADFRGRVVMLNFWSAACPPCRRKMPAMQQVLDELGEQGFVILAVNVNDLPAVAGSYIEDNGYTFTVVKDDGNVSSLYQVTGIPLSFFIDRQGIIQDVYLGLITEERLRELVLKLL